MTIKDDPVNALKIPVDALYDPMYAITLKFRHDPEDALLSPYICSVPVTAKLAKLAKLAVLVPEYLTLPSGQEEAV